MPKVGRKARSGDSRINGATSHVQSFSRNEAAGSATAVVMTLGKIPNQKPDPKTVKRLFMLICWKTAKVDVADPHMYQKIRCKPTQGYFECSVLSKLEAPKVIPEKSRRTNFALEILKKDNPGSILEDYPNHAVTFYPAGAVFQAESSYGEGVDEFAEYTIAGGVNFIPAASVYRNKDGEVNMNKKMEYKYKSLAYQAFPPECPLKRDIEEYEHKKQIIRISQLVWEMHCANGSPGMASGYLSSTTDWISMVVPLNMSNEVAILRKEGKPGIEEIVISLPDKTKAEEFTEDCLTDGADIPSGKFIKDIKEKGSDEKGSSVIFTGLTANVESFVAGKGRVITGVSIADLVRKNNVTCFTDLGIVNEKVARAFMEWLITGVTNISARISPKQDEPHETILPESDTANVRFNAILNEIYVDWHHLVVNYGVALPDFTAVTQIMSQNSSHFDRSNVTNKTETDFINAARKGLKTSGGIIMNSIVIPGKAPTGAKFYLLFPPSTMASMIQMSTLKKMYKQSSMEHYMKTQSDMPQAEGEWIRDAKAKNLVPRDMEGCMTLTIEEFLEKFKLTPKTLVENALGLKDFLNLRGDGSGSSLLIVAVNEAMVKTPYDPNSLNYTFEMITGTSPSSENPDLTVPSGNFNEVIEMEGKEEWLECMAWRKRKNGNSDDDDEYQPNRDNEGKSSNMPQTVSASASSSSSTSSSQPPPPQSAPAQSNTSSPDKARQKQEDAQESHSGSHNATTANSAGQDDIDDGLSDHEREEKEKDKKNKKIAQKRGRSVGGADSKSEIQGSKPGKRQKRAVMSDLVDDALGLDADNGNETDG